MGYFTDLKRRNPEAASVDTAGFKETKSFNGSDWAVQRRQSGKDVQTSPGAGGVHLNRVLGAINRGLESPARVDSFQGPMQHSGFAPLSEPAQLDYEAFRETAEATPGIQLMSMEATDEGSGVIQGFWKQVIAATLIGLVGGGIIAATAGAAAPVIIGLAAVGGGILLGGGTAATAKGIEKYKDSQPQVTIRELPGANRKNYLTGYRDLKAALGTADPNIVFDDASHTIKCYQSFRYLREALPQIDLYLTDMVPQDDRANVAKVFLNPHHVAKAEKEQENLSDQAKNRAANFTYSDPKTEEYQKALDETGSTREGLVRLMTENDGLVIGEGHTEQGSKALVMENLQQLKNAGVDTIYLEHVKTNYQPAIDQWFESQDSMPGSVERAMDNTDISKNLKGKKYNILKLIKAAVASGIRVVGVDNDAASSDGTKGGRVIKMNVLLEDLVNGDTSRNGKYIVIVGADHASTAVDETQSYGVKRLPGVSDLLGIPAVRYDLPSDTLTIDMEAILS